MPKFNRSEEDNQIEDDFRSGYVYGKNKKVKAGKTSKGSKKAGKKSAWDIMKKSQKGK